jgi:hypothetical protein
MRRLNPISGDASAMLADSDEDLSSDAVRPAAPAAPAEPDRLTPGQRDPLRMPKGPALYPGGHFAQTWLDRVEAFVSRLSMRDNFWHSVCSLIWLPLAFFSGIRMKQVGETTYGPICRSADSTATGIARWPAERS